MFLLLINSTEFINCTGCLSGQINIKLSLIIGQKYNIKLVLKTQEGKRIPLEITVGDPDPCKNAS
jgi:hypothetical protein